MTAFQILCKQIQGIKHESNLKQMERTIETTPNLTDEDRKDLFFMLELQSKSLTRQMDEFLERQRLPLLPNYLFSRTAGLKLQS